MARYSNMYFQMYSLQPAKGRKSFQPVTWEPLLDIYESDKALVIQVELPGLQKEQVCVTVEGNVLTIEGERPKQVPPGTVHVHQMEIPYGRFARRIPLPDHSDVDNIDASFHEGYLRIEIPRIPGT